MASERFNGLEYAYELTDEGRRWIDLQERYGAPPDQFRYPAAFAAWRATHPNVPWLVKIDLKVHPVRALPWSSSGVGRALPEFVTPWER